MLSDAIQQESFCATYKSILAKTNQPTNQPAPNFIKPIQLDSVSQEKQVIEDQIKATSYI